MVLSQRARSLSQKADRRSAILAAARRLFEQQSFDRISMASIAEHAGMAKGTVFLYFKTKEELFYLIAVEEFQHWLDGMDSLFLHMAGQKKMPATEVFLTRLAERIAPYTLLLQIITIFHTVLEHNISYEQALRFKQMMYERLPKTGALLERCVPGLLPGQGFKFILWMYALVIGFRHMSEPAPIVMDVYRKDAALRRMHIRFEDSYFDALKTILDGWLVQNQRHPQKKNKQRGKS